MEPVRVVEWSGAIFIASIVFAQVASIFILIYRGVTKKGKRK